jgi:hypothetical protein
MRKYGRLGGQPRLFGGGDQFWKELAAQKWQRVWNICTYANGAPKFGEKIEQKGTEETKEGGRLLIEIAGQAAGLFDGSCRPGVVERPGPRRAGLIVVQSFCSFSLANSIK